MNESHETSFTGGLDIAIICLGVFLVVSGMVGFDKMAHYACFDPAVKRIEIQKEKELQEKQAKYEELRKIEPKEAVKLKIGESRVFRLEKGKNEVTPKFKQEYRYKINVQKGQGKKVFCIKSKNYTYTPECFTLKGMKKVQAPKEDYWFFIHPDTDYIEIKATRAKK